MKHLMLIEEWHKVVQSSGSGRTRWIDTIHDDPSSPKSYSASLLLKKDLEEKEFDDLKKMTGAPDWIIKDTLRNPDSARKRRLDQMKVTMNNLQFLKDMEKKRGELFCEYCGKGPLVIYDINPDEITPEKLDNPNYRFNTKFNPKNGATCDHKQPQSKGGKKFDYSNLAVACEPCNKRKGNMDWLTWEWMLSQKKKS
jgi:5-methylcytosine-specific restriction endonuclease McrA